MTSASIGIEADGFFVFLFFISVFCFSIFYFSFCFSIFTLIYINNTITQIQIYYGTYGTKYGLIGARHQFNLI
jgi:hypothetical protein